jgi:hypothetical protein
MWPRSIGENKNKPVTFINSLKNWSQLILYCVTPQAFSIFDFIGQTTEAALIILII